MNLFCGCQKTETRQTIFWIESNTNGLLYRLSYMPLPEGSIDHILKEIHDKNKASILIYLAKGVSISNSFDLLMRAEKYNITNFSVIINQDPPPLRPVVFPNSM